MRHACRGRTFTEVTLYYLPLDVAHTHRAGVQWRVRVRAQTDVAAALGGKSTMDIRVHVELVAHFTLSVSLLRYA